MSLSWLIYFASVSSSVGLWLALIAIAGLVISVGASIAMAIQQLDYDPNVRPKFGFRLPIMFIAIGLVSCLMPSERTIYMMVGVQMVEEIAESPEAARIGDRLITLIESKLDQAIAEIPEPTSAQPAQAQPENSQ